MNSTVRVHHAADLTYFEGTSGIFEGLHHLPWAEEAQIATLTERAAVAALRSRRLEGDFTTSDASVPLKQLCDGLVTRDIGSALAGAAGHGVAAAAVLDQQMRRTDLGHFEKRVSEEKSEKSREWVNLFR